MERRAYAEAIPLALLGSKFNRRRGRRRYDWWYWAAHLWQALYSNVPFGIVVPPWLPSNPHATA